MELETLAILHGELLHVLGQHQEEVIIMQVAVVEVELLEGDLEESAVAELVEEKAHFLMQCLELKILVEVVVELEIH